MAYSPKEHTDTIMEEKIMLHCSLLMETSQ